MANARARRGLLCWAAALAFALAVSPGARAAGSDAEAVKAFLAGVFARAAKGAEIQDRGTYTPGLLAMMKHANPSEPCLDGDPLLDCQDCTPLKDWVIDVTSVAGGTAQAKVAFTVVDTHSESLVTLKLVGGAWRIDEIGRPSMPSLRAFLRKCP